MNFNDSASGPRCTTPRPERVKGRSFHFSFPLLPPALAFLSRFRLVDARYCVALWLLIGLLGPRVCAPLLLLGNRRHQFLVRILDRRSNPHLSARWMESWVRLLGHKQPPFPILGEPVFQWPVTHTHLHTRARTSFVVSISLLLFLFITWGNKKSHSFVCYNLPLSLLVSFALNKDTAASIRPDEVGCIIT